MMEQAVRQEQRLGIVDGDSQVGQENLIHYIALKLLANGLPVPDSLNERLADPLGAPRLLSTYHQRLKRLDRVHCPPDARIESFLKRHFDRVRGVSGLQLPDMTIVLDRHGIARQLSLPLGRSHYQNDLVSSYRVRNGVLHNPLHDRRTTKGTFHVTEGGLPVPGDKKAVPKETFAALFRHAMNPPEDMQELPFTAEQPQKARAMVSLLIRPLLSPEVPGVSREQRMEVRFFAPGSLVSNLDFVESIFGNAGDPFLPENDAALDALHWSGHTGCVILAPHLTKLKAKDVGLPQKEQASERQLRDGMFWESEEDLYNGGTPFKLTCRTEEGVIVTLIADNYFGYCKKEVKTQLSYAANLAGNCEEEHAGGAIAYASYNMGDEFLADSRRYNNRTIDDVLKDYPSFIEPNSAGYGTDRNFPEIHYIPEDARCSVREQTVSWERNGNAHSLPLLPDHIYITPSGYKVRLQKHPAAPSWRLIGTLSEGVFCHKPCTVSGGGKSEISKSIADYLLHGPIFVADFESDMKVVESIFDRDYSDRWHPDGEVQPDYQAAPSRRLLDPARSLGSVIKLLSPSADYTDEYNAWLESIPGHIYAVVFIIKRMFRPEEGGDWHDQFSVDIVNGMPGHELKFGERALVGTYLRVGLLGTSTWRTYKLRQDFAPADKIQTEDDISASIVVPDRALNNPGPFTPSAMSYKFVENCEYRLFQRPDDAIHRGLDKQTEADLARTDNFIVNFEPLGRDDVRRITERAVDLSQFTAPMQELLRNVLEEGDDYVVCSATPRLIDGEPSRNPRYLQTRPDLVEPRDRYIANVGTRLYRGLREDEPVHVPVHAVLLGRRNNPPDRAAGIRPLSVYSPIHYQELPELFMDFISALTGKSPSTTGAGSEGALTKGPFNALLPITDLNNALVSYLLTGLAGFSTPAGFIGPDVRVDHDISLLIPELWCRLSPEERDPAFLIREGMLEKIEDFEFDGKPIPAGRLGYRITGRFIRTFAGRVFDNPRKVFEEQLLKPEIQDPAAFADGILHIAEAQERVARNYFDDGSYELAAPPLQALLHIMVHGQWEGKSLQDPEFRAMFTRDWLLESEWYQARLRRRQRRDIRLWSRHIESLERFLVQADFALEAEQLDLRGRLAEAQVQLERVQSPDYLTELQGFLGADALSDREA